MNRLRRVAIVGWGSGSRRHTQGLDRHLVDPAPSRASLSDLPSGARAHVDSELRKTQSALLRGTGPFRRRNLVPAPWRLALQAQQVLEAIQPSESADGVVAIQARVVRPVATPKPEKETRK